MKRLIIIIIYFVTISVVLTSCGKTEYVNRPVLDENSVNDIELAKEIALTALYWRQLDTEKMERTKKYIKDEFGINLNFNIVKDYELTGEKTAKLIQQSEEGGIYYFYYTNLDIIKKLIDEGAILPLNQLLEDNETWKQLPIGMKDMYYVGDDNTWALSRGYYQNIFGRVFKKDNLEALGIEKPSTLAQFYEMLKRDKVGLPYYNPLSINDIFYANNTPLAQSYKERNITSIVYDIKTRSYEDSMLKPDIEDTLNYINTLFTNKLVKVASSRRQIGYRTVDVLESDSNYTNCYGIIPNSFFNNDKYEIIYGLSGVNNENINPLSYNYVNNGYYVLATNTENAKEVINTFVSIFYGNVKGYIATKYGPPGENYTFNGDTVNIKDFDFFNTNDFSIVTNNPLISLDTINIDANSDIKEVLEQYGKEKLSKAQYIENGLSSNKMFNLTRQQAYPEVFPSIDSYGFSNPASVLFESIFENIYRGFVTTKEGVIEYKETMKQLGEQKIIDELNSKIGVDTLYKY